MVSRVVVVLGGRGGFSAAPTGDRKFPTVRYDIICAGGGGAATAVLHALAHLDLDGGLSRGVSVLVVDPVPLADTDARHRTWSFWAEGTPSIAPAISATWRHLRVAGAHFDERLDLDPLRYHLVRSADFAEFVEDQITRAPNLEVSRVDAAVTSVSERGETASVTWDGGEAEAWLVLDSRPTAPARAPSVWWWQHFRGWTLPSGVVDESTASMMDFRTPQPEKGLSFGYLLPLPDGRALAEYTEFSPERLDDAGYDAKLRGYLDLLGVDDDVVPVHVETGAIPMTEAPFTRRPSARVLRIGTAGGATRGSTGYTFAAMLRDGHAVAHWVATHRPASDVPINIRAPYPSRHRWLDAVQLQALADGRVNGPDFYTGLFASQPASRVLRFLDGTTSLAEDAKIVFAAPIVPMIQAALTDTATRVHRGTRALTGRPADPEHVVPAPPTPGRDLTS